MRNVLLPFILYVLQCMLILRGAAWFGMYLSPFVLLLVSLVLLVVYMRAMHRPASDTLPETATPAGKRLVGAAVGIATIALLYPLFNAVFQLFPDPGTGSDVMPQLEALYQRNSKGVQPYFPLEQFSWHPFPVYMPLHWLPVGIGYWLQIDVRWVGVLFLAAACGFWGYYLWAPNRIGVRILTICLPAVGTLGYLLFAMPEMSVSFEFIVAAYYLLLALGMYYGSLFWIVSGIIACLLSRYTLLFWLPLMAIVMWRAETRKRTVTAMLIVILSVILLYVLPFYVRNPSILTDGVTYHNLCYKRFWEGQGDPDAKLVYENGLNFAYYTRSYLSGRIEERLGKARMIQGALMIVLMVAGIWLQNKWKGKMHYAHLGLGMLYAFILVFFMSSPFTFVYYYICLTMLSAVLCAAIILQSPTRQVKK